MSAVDPDQPLESFPFHSMRGTITDLIASVPDKTATFRDLLRLRWSANFVTGAPEQVADVLEDWFEAGVDGFNLVYSVTPGTFADFVDGVVPVLQARGLVQNEYAPGTLREKISVMHVSPTAIRRRRAVIPRVNRPYCFFCW